MQSNQNHTLKKPVNPSNFSVSLLFVCHTVKITLRWEIYTLISCVFYYNCYFFYTFIGEKKWVKSTLTFEENVCINDLNRVDRHHFNDHLLIENSSFRQNIFSNIYVHESRELSNKNKLNRRKKNEILWPVRLSKVCVNVIVFFCFVC